MSNTLIYQHYTLARRYENESRKQSDKAIRDSDG